MSDCMKTFGLEDGLDKVDVICNKDLATLFLSSYIQNRLYDDCTSELRNFYANFCLKTDTISDFYCRVHPNVALLTSGLDVENDFIKCLLFDKYDVKTTREFLYNGASCPKNDKLFDEYVRMKSFHENRNCPAEYNVNLNTYQLKYSEGTYCKQFVEMYETYCVD